MASLTSEEGSDRTGGPLKLRELDQATSSAIRKGQVITKVSDVVRELVENALDANATSIRISLVDHGLNKIEVSDNGHGIPEEHVEQIFKGGYTSKLNDSNYLSRDKYLGFKGEALNAICSAGKVAVYTKTEFDNVGRSYQLDFAGNITANGKISLRTGTQIEIRGLFESLPVRRRWLQQVAVAKTEMKEIEYFLKGVGIAYPKCHINFRTGVSVWSKPSVQTVEESLVTVLGINIAKKMGTWGPVKVETGSGSVEDTTLVLHLPKKPVDMRTMSYTSNKLCMIFCNRKRVFVRDFEKLLHRYITAVVEKSQPADQRRFPVSAVLITVPPKDADFNRDVDKTKVHLVHKDKIYEAIEEALEKFYEIDRKEIHENGECPGQDNGTSKTINEESFTSINDDLSAAVPETGAANTAVSSRKIPTRQETITSFLENIPSTTTAFSNSPVKEMNRFQSTLMDFPSSKPAVETALLNPSKDPPPKPKASDNPTRKESAMGISNFQLCLDSQGSQDNDSEQVVSGISSNNAADDKEAHEINKSFEGWMSGRVVDKQGHVVENICVNAAAPSAQPSTSKKEEEYEKFRSHLLMPSKPTPGKSLAGSAHFKDSLSTLTTPRSSKQQDLPSKKPKLDMVNVPSPQTSSGLSPGIWKKNLSMHKVFQPDILTLFSRIESATSFSQQASGAVEGVRFSLAGNSEKNMVQPKTNDAKKPVSFERSRLDWPGVTEFLKNVPNIRLTPKILGKVISGLEGLECYAAQTEDAVGIFMPKNMVAHFPEGLPPYNSYNASDLFSKFVSRPDIRNSPAAADIFVVTKDFDSLLDVYFSMQNARDYSVIEISK